MSARADHAIEVARSIQIILKRQPAEVQGAVLAQLLAIFLAGHRGDGEDRVREEVLEAHIASVRRMMDHMDAVRRMATTLAKETT